MIYRKFKRRKSR